MNIRLLRALGALLLLCCVRLAPAAELEQPSLTLAVGGKGLFYYLPLALADRLGYFKDEGLTVEIVDFPGGAKALQAVMGDSAQFAAGSFEHVLHMQAKGQPVQAVTLLARYPAMVLALATPVAARFKTFEDLRGLKIGVTAPGSSTHLFLNTLLNQHAIPASEVAVIGVGAGAGAVAAIRHGGLDGIVHLDPVIYQLEAAGEVKAIVDTRTAEGATAVYGGTYHASCLYAKAAFLKANPQTAQAVVNAQVRALRWLAKASLAQIVDTVPEAYWGGDRAAYSAALKQNLAIMSPDGLLDRAGAGHVQAALMAMEPAYRAAPADLAAAIDNQFVERVPLAKP